VIWERDLGIVQKLLVSPASRSALVTGKALAGGMRSIVQAVIVTIVAAAIGVHLRFDPLSILGVVAVVILGSALFATFSLSIACLVRSRERFMGIGQLLTMPLFFASSAIYPVSLMPHWLKVVATLNPLTYMVDALRSMMIAGGVSDHGLATDFAVLSVTFIVLIAIATRLYSRLAT
jgi:ABC-2 type transport system permease protein